MRSLQYRPAAMHGNPWLRLLRREVEELARSLHGERYLREQQARTELARINRELKQLRAQLSALGERRVALLSELGEQSSPRQLPCPPRPRYWFQLSSYHSHSGHSSASDGNERCSGFTFLYTMS